MSTDFLSKSGDPFGNKDVINSKLEVGMFVADMELSVGILRGSVAIHRPVPCFARKIPETEASSIGSKPTETGIVAGH